MMDPEAAASLRLRLADTPIRVAEGMEGLLEAASLEAADTVLTAVVGIVGLRPTLAAIRAGKRIALDRLRRPLLGMERGGPCRSDGRAGSGPSQLEYGGQDLRGLGHHDEQGTGIY